MRKFYVLLLMITLVALPLNAEARHHHKKTHAGAHHKLVHHHVAKAKKHAKTRHKSDESMY